MISTSHITLDNLIHLLLNIMYLCVLFPHFKQPLFLFFFYTHVPFKLGKVTAGMKQNNKDSRKLECSSVWRMEIGCHMVVLFADLTSDATFMSHHFLEQ